MHKLKNKTYEEIYGLEKANILKSIRSKQWKGFKRTEENKKNCSLSKLGDKNPTKQDWVRKKMSNSAIERFKNNEERLKCGNGNRGRKISIEQKNKLSKALKGRSYEDLFGKEKADMMKAKRKQEALARTKEQKERALQASYKALGSHPNKFEVRALKHLESLYPNKFIFTGDGSMFINGKSPDAFSQELKAVALFNGIYWHLTRFNLEVNDTNKRIIEKIESSPFIEYGYKVLFIWEDEI